MDIKQYSLSWNNLSWFTYNVNHKRVGHPSESATLQPQLNFRTKSRFSPQQNMPAIRNEAQLQLALQAMERDPKLSIRAAVKRYLVPRTTLDDRRNGMLPRAETVPNSRNLTPLEEEVIVRRVLDLYEQGFSPGYDLVEDMAN